MVFLVIFLAFTSVMFSLVFVRLLAGLCKNYSVDFRNIQWKGGNEHWVHAHCINTGGPHAGSGVVRIDPLRFLAGCRTR